MYNGIGLRTARGSGTNGYVQSNKFFIRPKPSSISLPPPSTSISDPGAKKANKEILEHDRKRRIELRLIVLEETLADQGYTQAEIAEKLRETRAALEAAPLENPPEKRISDTQTHQIAARKEKQLETFRAALGIKLGDESPEHDTEEQKHHDKAQGLETEESGGEKDREQKKLTDGKQDHGDRERESSKKARATEEHRSKNDSHDKKNPEKKVNEVEHKKTDTRKGRYMDVSASDSSGEDVENDEMKPSRNTRGLDSRYDTDIRSSKKRSKVSEKDKISHYLDSDEDSDSSSKSGGGKTRKSRKVEKQRTYDSDSGRNGDDKRKRSHVKERPTSRRRYDHDESDSGHDSGRDNTRKSNKYVKHQRRYNNESKIDEDAKKKKGHAKELPSRRRHDSDGPDSDSVSAMEDTRKSRNFVKKQRRYDSSSETDEDDGRKKAHVNETSRKGRHDSDDSDSSSDDSESERGRKSRQYNDKRKKNDSETVQEKRSTKNKKIREKSRRHGSEYSSSGADDSESRSSDSASDSSDSSGSSGSSGYKRMDVKNGRRLKSIVEKDLSSGYSRKDDRSNEHRNRDHSSLLKNENRPIEMRNDRKEVGNNENQHVHGKRKIDEGRDDLPVLEPRGSGLGKSGKMRESLEVKKDRENRDHRIHHERRDNQRRGDYRYLGNSQKHYDEDDIDGRHESRDDRSHNYSKRRKFESSRQYARSERYDSASGEDSKSYRRR